MDIVPFTIFVGKNNSEKSFSALLLYSLFNPFNNTFSSSHLNFSVKSLEFLLKNNEILFEEYNEEFIRFLDSVGFSEILFEFPIEKFDILLSDGIGRFYLDLLENNLKNNFNYNLNKFNNIMNRNSFEINYNGINIKNIGGKLTSNSSFLSLFDDKLEFKNNLILNVYFKNDNICIELNPLTLKLSNMENKYIPTIVYGILSEFIIDNLIDKSIYIPASSYSISNNLNFNLDFEINGNGNRLKFIKI